MGEGSAEEGKLPQRMASPSGQEREDSRRQKLACLESLNLKHRQLSIHRKSGIPEKFPKIPYQQNREPRVSTIRTLASDNKNS